MKAVDRLRRWATAVAALATLAAAGCSNNPHAAPERLTRDDGTPWRTLYRAWDDPRSLDPQVTYDEVSHRITSLVYDTLLQYAPFEEKAVLEPCLAAEMPRREEHPDGSVTYHCAIQPGLRFHDDPCFPGGKGRELVAEDFHYTFLRIADPKVECPIASTLAKHVKGLDAAYHAAEKSGTFDYGQRLPGLEVTGRYTFRIHLTSAYPQIKYWLAYGFTAPVAREAVEYYDGATRDGVARPLFRFKPVGTGPFALDEWKRGRIIRLVRNPGYAATRFPQGGWPAEDEARLRPFAGSRLPMSDEIQFLPIREAIPIWTLFKQGYLDASGLSKDVFGAVITGAGDLDGRYRARGIELKRDVETATWYIMFNMDDPVIGGNRKLRQALSKVFDAATMHRVFFNGIWQETAQFVPPGIEGHDPALVNPYRQTDVAAARELVAEAGYPGGTDPKTGRPLELALDVTADDALSRQLAEYQQGQFQQLGIRVVIRENTFASMQERQQNGGYQMVIAGWSADYPDPENFFFLLYGPNVPPKGYNQSRYRNPEFDRLFERMATLEDGPERREIIGKMNAILAEDCVVAPLSTPARYALYQPWARPVVRNTVVAKMGGAKYSVVDPAAREVARRELNRRPWWPLAAAAALAAGAGLAAWRRVKTDV
jgi:ABC-type oligopeptide transport system substrate-binding subunit